MNDHLLKTKDLLVKYKVPIPSKSPKPVLNPDKKNNGRSNPTNAIFPKRDHSLLYMIYAGVCDPVKILSAVSVTSLLFVYFVNKEERERLILFIFTCSLIIIVTTIEVYGEIKMNQLYKFKAQSNDSRVIVEDKIYEMGNDYIDIGDVMFLKRGDVVSADSVLIKSNNIEVDRSTLTGDKKHIKRSYTKRSAIFEESENVLLAGDKILSGRGYALVVRTGKNNKISEIYEKVVNFADLESLLYTEINLFFIGSFLASLILSLTMCLFGLINGIDFVSAVDVVFSVALALIPECIPSTIKLMLFTSVSKLENKSVVMRDIGAIEKLGLVTVVVADKRAFAHPEDLFCSYVHDGEDLIDVELAFEDNDEKAMEYLQSIGHITGLVSRDKSSRMRQPHHGALEALSNVIESYFVGITRMSYKVKDLKIHGFDGTVVDELDFMSLYITGTVESVLKECTKIKIDGKVVKLTSEKRFEILEACNERKDEFHTVVAIAQRPYGKNERKVKVKGPIFIGAFFIEEVTEFDTPLVTNLLKAADINFALVTNEKNRARLNSGKNILGMDLKHEPVISDSAEDNRLISTTDLATADHSTRVEILNKDNFLLFDINSDDKQQIIRDLKSLRHIVCYIGTDIDDCKAMNEADVAICFNNSGIICKEACSLVLKSGKVDDLIYCIEESRLFFNNLQKAVKYISSHIIPQFTPFLFFTCFGTPLPLSAILLIFLNYLVEMIPAIFLTYEKPEFNLLTERPSTKDDISSLPMVQLATDNRSVLAPVRKYCQRLTKIMSNGLVYHMDTLSRSIFEIGIITTIGCMLAFFASLYDSKIPFSKMFFSGFTYFGENAPLLELTDGTVIDGEEQIHILYKGQSTFFLSLVICQFTSMLVCRRERHYFFHRFFDNFKLIFWALVGVVVSFTIVYVSFFENFLLLKRPNLAPLMFPLIASAVILGIDTLKKYKLKQSL